MTPARSFALATLLLSSAFVVNPALAADNCSDVKNTLTREYQVVHWSNCYSPTPQVAEADGAVHCAEVIGEGAIPTVIGHRTVQNWVVLPIVGKVPLPNTYLGYCAGVRPPGLPPGAPRTVDTGKANDARKAIEEALQKMKK
jgi:hypothetical protein